MEELQERVSILQNILTEKEERIKFLERRFDTRVKTLRARLEETEEKEAQKVAELNLLKRKYKKWEKDYGGLLENFFFEKFGRFPTAQVMSATFASFTPEALHHVGDEAAKKGTHGEQVRDAIKAHVTEQRLKHEQDAHETTRMMLANKIEENKELMHSMENDIEDTKIEVAKRTARVAALARENEGWIELLVSLFSGVRADVSELKEWIGTPKSISPQNFVAQCYQKVNLIAVQCFKVLRKALYLCKDQKERFRLAKLRGEFEVELRKSLLLGNKAPTGSSMNPRAPTPLLIKEETTLEDAENQTHSARMVTEWETKFRWEQSGKQLIDISLPFNDNVRVEDEVKEMEKKSAPIDTPLLRKSTFVISRPKVEIGTQTLDMQLEVVEDSSGYGGYGFQLTAREVVQRESDGVAATLGRQAEQEETEDVLQLKLDAAHWDQSVFDVLSSRGDRRMSEAGPLSSRSTVGQLSARKTARVVAPDAKRTSLSSTSASMRSLTRKSSMRRKSGLSNSDDDWHLGDGRRKSQSLSVSLSPPPHRASHKRDAAVQAFFKTKRADKGHQTECNTCDKSIEVKATTKEVGTTCRIITSNGKAKQISLSPDADDDTTHKTAVSKEMEELLTRADLSVQGMKTKQAQEQLKAATDNTAAPSITQLTPRRKHRSIACESDPFYVDPHTQKLETLVSLLQDDLTEVRHEKKRLLTRNEQLMMDKEKTYKAFEAIQKKVEANPRLTKSEKKMIVKGATVTASKEMKLAQRTAKAQTSISVALLDSPHTSQASEASTRRASTSTTSTVDHHSPTKDKSKPEPFGDATFEASTLTITALTEHVSTQTRWRQRRIADTHNQQEAREYRYDCDEVVPCISSSSSSEGEQGNLHPPPGYDCQTPATNMSVASAAGFATWLDGGYQPPTPAGGTHPTALLVPHFVPPKPVLVSTVQQTDILTDEGIESLRGHQQALTRPVHALPVMKAMQTTTKVFHNAVEMNKTRNISDRRPGSKATIAAGLAILGEKEKAKEIIDNDATTTEQHQPTYALCSRCAREIKALTDDNPNNSAKPEPPKHETLCVRDESNKLNYVPHRATIVGSDLKLERKDTYGANLGARVISLDGASVISELYPPHSFKLLRGEKHAAVRMAAQSEDGKLHWIKHIELTARLCAEFDNTGGTGRWDMMKQAIAAHEEDQQRSLPSSPDVGSTTLLLPYNILQGGPTTIEVEVQTDDHYDVEGPFPLSPSKLYTPTTPSITSRPSPEKPTEVARSRGPQVIYEREQVLVEEPPNVISCIILHVCKSLLRNLPSGNIYYPWMGALPEEPLQSLHDQQTKRVLKLWKVEVVAIIQLWHRVLRYFSDEDPTLEKYLHNVSRSLSTSFHGIGSVITYKISNKEQTRAESKADMEALTPETQQKRLKQALLKQKLAVSSNESSSGYSDLSDGGSSFMQQASTVGSGSSASTATKMKRLTKRRPNTAIGMNEMLKEVHIFPLLNDPYHRPATAEDPATGTLGSRKGEFSGSPYAAARGSLLSDTTMAKTLNQMFAGVTGQDATNTAGNQPPDMMQVGAITASFKRPLSAATMRKERAKKNQMTAVFPRSF